MEKKGFLEELYLANKTYPEANIIQRLSPKEYIEVLILHAAKQLGDKFKRLAEENRFDEIIQLTEHISNLVSDHRQKFSLPLSMITYNYSNRKLPVMEDLFLSRLNLLHNDKHSMKNFFKALKYEMLTADSVDFMVSFIRMSGLQLIIRPLLELEKRNIPVRIITSTYLGITEVKALQKLMEFSNVQVKIIDTQKESFHTKAYMFHRNSGLNTVIIGSSNLSHSALMNGHELNVKLPDTSFLPIYEQTKRIFDQIWNSEETVALDSEFVHYYSEFIEAKRNLENFRNKEMIAAETKRDYQITHNNIKPNAMQEKALRNLQNTRKNGNNKGVIIAATGTGKTYLSAFDVKAFNPKKLLFIAHREELLDNAIKTFQQVIPKQEIFGKITGTVKEFDKPYLFSTIQSLHKDEILQRFKRDEFDYIIVDEFHHAEARTYRKVIDYFQPKFLLGLTATPERMDGRDVLALCDHNIVYEIRLREALEANLLAPFHYFGVSDHTVDYSKIPLKNGFFEEDALVKALKTNERTDFIIEMINTYGYHGDRMIGLGFCANIEHAKYMSEEFNKRGYHTTYLTGEHSIDYREKVIKQLEDENDPLELIFTVNIFNEGIDIPKLNLILFLRPTESSTVFIQQLGRGLRKVEGKEFVTILDFIGNYQKSFVVPLALSGQINHKAFDKDSLRVAITHEFADLPAGSYVDLDPITQKEILDRIDSIKMNSTDMLKSLYQQFKNELGRAPEILDFLYYEQSPSLTFFIHKYQSWVKTKEKMNDINELDRKILDHPLMSEIVERLENQLPIKWPYDFIILELAFLQKKVSYTNVIKQLEKRFATKIDLEKHKTLIGQAMARLANPYKKQKWSFGKVVGDQFVLNDDILEVTQDAEFYQYLKDRIDYGIIEFRRTHHPERFLAKGEKLVLYQNYTRNDLIFLFEAGVKEGSWREGVSRAGNHYFLFVNLNKSEKVEKHLQYKDYFIDQRHFHWQSQNQTSHESSVGQNYIYHKERGIHIHLFVRKFDQMHGMTLPFMYLGEVDYVSSYGDKPMNIKWRLHHPVPEDLYIDLIR
ncbi:Superfamily II DNA or RNA helicase [Parageobacillus thermantarcticus]|uniref:Superfamily II DNA or RNA helicase n=2 Tax=Parageobacillus thermantarcticus TaxID=186116 RepID=A0A1I0TFI0_9BACL|nr:Superfamily II DNA or RNA helicase [Parageobacillus thermantarcticus]